MKRVVSYYTLGFLFASLAALLGAKSMVEEQEPLAPLLPVGFFHHFLTP